MVSADGGGPVEGLGPLELDRLAAHARAALEWRQRADALRAEGESDGVRATVAGSGSLVDLSILDRACADGGTALVEKVSAAISAARLEVGRDVARLCADIFGEDAPQTEVVRRSWEDGARRHPRVLGSDDGPADPPAPRTGPAPSGGGGGTW